jgi:hypothetical protein
MVGVTGVELGSEGRVGGVDGEALAAWDSSNSSWPGEGFSMDGFGLNMDKIEFRIASF